MSSKNVREILWVAVYGLSTNEGTVQERLESAAVGLCSLPGENDLPKQYEEALSSIRHDLTQEPAVGVEGRIKSTTRKMSDQEAQRVAKEILGLYITLRGGI
jgi:hypothetical protein